MENKKIDLRVIKTRNRIYETLLLLLKKHSFEEIRVSDICEKSLINRSTFYAHFSDKYELLASFISDLKDSLSEELKKNKNISNTKQYYIEMIRLLLNHIDDQKDIYYAILSTNRNSIINDMIYNAIDEEIINHLKTDQKLSYSGIPTEIIAKFYIGATVNVGISWLQNNKKYDKQDILNYFNTLIPDNIG